MVGDHWDRRLGGPQSRFGRYREEKNIYPVGNRTLAVQHVAVPTELSRLTNKILYDYLIRSRPG
jgi:hypothetical protein